MTPRELASMVDGAYASLSSRAVYLQVPRPPGGGREYRPLRAKSSYERKSWGSPTRISGGGEYARPDSARRLRSARPRMQGEPGGDDIERGASDFSSAAAGALEDKGLYLGNEAGAQYAQVPGVTAWGGGAAPPQPSLQDPSPRRRGTLQPTPVHADSASAPRPPAAPASETATARRGQMVRELAPLLHAVAGLTHETNLGKLVRQLHAVVLMLAQADA